MKAFIKKWWPEVTVVTSWVVTNFGPQIMTVLTAFVAAHPHISTTVGAVALIAGRLSTSPTKAA
jgi:hypothetical protein